MDMPQSDACFVKVYPRETTEAFLDGHVSAFAFIGGVPLSVLYDNTKIAVAKMPMQIVAGAVTEAIQIGAAGFDAVKLIALAKLERRPARLDLAAYPHLPKLDVMTSCRRLCIQSASSASSGALNSCRTARRSAADLPLISRSISNSASIRCTASSAIGKAKAGFCLALCV